MTRLFFFCLFVTVFPLSAHAQDSGGMDVHLQMEDELDDIYGIYEIQEDIDISEDNCYSIKKDRDECKCDSLHLYNQYNEYLDELNEKRPEWVANNLHYDFDRDGKSYDGKESLEEFREFSAGTEYMECE